MPKGAVSGGKCSGSFAWYDPDSSLWRTCQLCLTGGWMKYLGRWPKAGMMQNGHALELPTLEHHTEEKESFLWPTPSAREPGWKNLIPVDKEGNTPSSSNQRWYDQKTGRLLQKGLSQVVRMWPTPCRRDYRSPRCDLEKRKGHVQGLEIAVYSEENQPEHGQLNPVFVEWLMGYPEGWTDLEHSEMP